MVQARALRRPEFVLLFLFGYGVYLRHLLLQTDGTQGVAEPDTAIAQEKNFHLMPDTLVIPNFLALTADRHNFPAFFGGFKGSVYRRQKICVEVVLQDVVCRAHPKPFDYVFRIRLRRQENERGIEVFFPHN